MSREFGREHERPCPSVRTLESASIGLGEIRELGRDLGVRELSFEQRANVSRFSSVRIDPQQRREQPVQLVVELVRVRSFHTRKGMPCEARRELGREFMTAHERRCPNAAGPAKPMTTMAMPMTASDRRALALDAA